jgi:hypothetical protein
MPINVTCPNPDCAKPLSVQEQYAGMQGQCPYCKTVFTFPNAAPAAPAMPPPVAAPAPPAPEPEAMTPVMEWDRGRAPAPRGALPGRLDLLSLILYCAGIFFLLLLFIAILVPWLYLPSPLGGTFPRSGMDVAIGIILFVLDLLIMARCITALVFNFALPFPHMVDRVLSYTMVAAAWLGIFGFWCMLAGLFRPWALGEYAKGYDAIREQVSRGFGLWLAFFFALFLAGIFGFLAVREPPELPLSPDPNAFTRRWLLLVCLGGSAVFLGLLVLLIHVI